LGAIAVIIEKEMGFTHADIFRLLPRTMGDNPYEIVGLPENCTLPSGTLKITLAEERERKMVLVTLPCTQVTFEYTNVTDADRLRFVRYFDLRFMKGLG